jgi:hypothetical protein
MELVHQKHNISDKVWGLLETHLPGREASWGRVAKNNRLFKDAVL